ncbi:DUF3102 domain-containing protein [Bacillus cereus]|uniref:DUF3102 domain-containing protein n=1 Tax=Bacillus cereus TaxID=1396 RepID=A0A9X6WWH4_BACCE|nr:DUF3102 domain-containing protein [Bacillus cereus]PFK10278.1 hypothetical protein COI98_24395 [Bacillus cereus]
MREVMDLSKDINVITAEIKSYQQIAGQSIFEIGKRLKYVKENDLVQGQWTNWCEKQCGIKRQTANRFIQAYEQFPNGTTSYQIESAKVFELLSLPQEINRQQFIEEPHTIPSTGEEKTVDEMTVRELREVKKSLKEKEKQLQQAEEKAKLAQKEATQARKSEQLTRKQLAELEQQEPQIVEREVVKEVEIVPDNSLNIIDELKDENAELKDTADFYKQKADALSKDVDDIKLEESSMNYIANKNVHNLIAYMDEFLKDVVVSSLMRGSIATASDATKELLDSRIEAFQEFLNDLKIAKTGRKIS